MVVRVICSTCTIKGSHGSCNALTLLPLDVARSCKTTVAPWCIRLMCMVELQCLLLSVVCNLCVDDMTPLDKRSMCGRVDANDIMCELHVCECVQVHDSSRPSLIWMGL